MPLNFPGPYELRINYTCLLAGASRQHQMRVSMDMSSAADPGDPFSDWTCVSRLGATPPLDGFTDSLVDLVRANYAAATSTFDNAELWEYDPGTFDAAWRSSYTIGLAGTNAGGGQVDGQAIITFRSANGGSARLDMRETVWGAGATFPISTADAAVQAVANYLIAPGSPAIARDNGFLIAALNFLPGSNEHAFKKRLR